MDRPITPYGYAIFCDDIRRELGNKVSLIGIYRGVAFWSDDFPITVPRLCIEVNWLQHGDDERRPTKIRVVSVDEGHEDGTETVVIEGDLPVEGFDQAPKTAPDANLMHAAIQIMLAPYVLEKPSTLKVRVMYGDEEYKLGTLRMVKAVTD